MKNLKIVSVSSRKENPTYNELSILRTHARLIHHSHEKDVVEFLTKLKEAYDFPTASVTLEVGRRVYDCVGSKWSHSCDWEILGEATYALGNPWDSI